MAIYLQRTNTRCY